MHDILKMQVCKATPCPSCSGQRAHAMSGKLTAVQLQQGDAEITKGVPTSASLSESDSQPELRAVSCSHTRLVHGATACTGTSSSSQSIALTAR